MKSHKDNILSVLPGKELAGDASFAGRGPSRANSRLQGSVVPELHEELSTRSPSPSKAASGNGQPSTWNTKGPGHKQSFLQAANAFERHGARKNTGRQEEFQSKVMARFLDIEVEMQHLHNKLCKKMDTFIGQAAQASLDVASESDSNHSGGISDKCPTLDSMPEGDGSETGESAKGRSSQNSGAGSKGRVDGRTSSNGSKAFRRQESGRKNTSSSSRDGSCNNLPNIFGVPGTIARSMSATADQCRADEDACISPKSASGRRPSFSSSAGLSSGGRRPSFSSSSGLPGLNQSTSFGARGITRISNIREANAEAQNVSLDQGAALETSSHRDDGADTGEAAGVAHGGEKYCSTGLTPFATKSSVNSRQSNRDVSIADKERATNLLKHRRHSHIALATWNFLDNPESSRGARIYDHVLPQFLVLSICFTLSQTLEPAPVPKHLARGIDAVIDAAFTVEILIRFVVGSSGPIKFLARPFNFIDTVSGLALLLRLVVALVPNFPEVDQAAAFLCLVSIFRLLKLMRKFQQIHLLFGAFKLALEALPVLMFMLAVMTLTFASAVYLVEPRDNLESLPKAIWFIMVTITTVGYGDIVPVSVGGTCIVFFLTFSSVLYMAVPLGIVGQAFKQVWEDRDRILLVKKTQAALVQWGYTATDIPLVFSIFDSQGEGELCLTDFRRMMTQMRIGLSDARIVELFQSFDSDKSGYVDDREFVRSVFPMAFQYLYGEVYDDEGRTAAQDQKCSCGNQLVPGGHFCGVCGKKVDADYQSESGSLF